MESLWMIKNLKISLQQNSIFVKFWKSPKSDRFFLFYNVYKENMYTIEKGGLKSKKSLVFTLPFQKNKKIKNLLHNLFFSFIFAKLSNESVILMEEIFFNNEASK